MSIDFEEDKSVLRPMQSSEQLPEKGFEGWIHRHLPYGPKINRTIVVFIVLIILGVAGFFFFAAVYNFNQVNSPDPDFLERVGNTRSR